MYLGDLERLEVVALHEADVGRLGGTKGAMSD